MSPEQCNIFVIMADAHGRGYRPVKTVKTVFTELFSRPTFASQIFCLCLKPLKRYKASKLTTLEKCYIYRHMAGAPVTLPRPPSRRRKPP